MKQRGSRPRHTTTGAISLIGGAAAGGAALLTRQAAAPDLTAYVPLPGVLGLTAVVLAALGAGLILKRPGPADHTRLRVLPWWWVLIGAVLITVSIWATTAALLSLADSAPQAARRVELRVEAVKTGLTVGAGAAGLVALLLGARRQWLGERTQAHQEYDAAEKRLTELYTKAGDQLGHDKAAVRLAGLHALGRLAHDTPGHRQTITDVICAYLRMPATPSGTPTGPPDPADHQEAATPPADPQELQVRATAQRILAEHLRWSRDEPLPPGTFWPGIDLDLTGAHLLDLDLSRCRIRQATFDGATLEGLTRFDGATFDAEATFTAAVFTRGADPREANHRAGFEKTLFNGTATFRATVFALRADFTGATFGEAALFGQAEFADRAVFRAASFTAQASFGAAAFNGEAVFRQAAFSGGVSFQQAVFADAPALWEATAQISCAAGRLWPEGWREDPLGDGSGRAQLIQPPPQSSGPPGEPSGVGSVPAPDTDTDQIGRAHV